MAVVSHCPLDDIIDMLVADTEAAETLGDFQAGI